MTTSVSVEKRPASDSSKIERTRAGSCFVPSVDILEKPEAIILLADIPGASRDGIDVRYENGTLTISCRVAPRQGNDTRFLSREFGIGDFQRSFRLGEDIDVSAIKAEYQDGVLTLTLPKVESRKPRKIAVVAK